MKFLRLFLRTIASQVLSLLGLIATMLPVVKKNRVLFSQSAGRYNGNSRYFFEFLCLRKWDVYWLARTQSQFEMIPSSYSSKTLIWKSIKSVWIVLTCEKIVISHGGGDFGLYWDFVKHKKVMNLWHGTGIKNVGILEKGRSKKSIKRHVKKETFYYDAVTVASDTFRYLFSSNHSIDVRKIFVTGDARTDIFVENFSRKECSDRYRALYAPTFRDYSIKENLFFPFIDNDADIKNLFDKCKDVVFFLRPHPNDINSIHQARTLEAKFPENAVCFDSNACSDIDAQLHAFDLIISDFSSIHFEPLIADISLIFVPFDREKFLETRGLAFKYDLVTPGPKVSNFEEFIHAIDEMRNGQPEWASHRKFVRDQFFNYTDSSARSRIECVLKNL